MNDFLLKTSIPITLFSKMLTFTDTKKSFMLVGGLLEAMINYNFNVDHSNPQDRKIIYECGKKMKFNTKHKRRKSPTDESVIRLLKSPAIMALGISTKFLKTDPSELCDRINLLLQEKQAGNHSDLFIVEIVAILDKLLKYKCTSKIHL